MIFEFATENVVFKLQWFELVSGKNRLVYLDYQLIY